MKKQEFEDLRKRMFRMEIILYVILGGGIIDFSKTNLIPIVSAFLG